MTAEGSSTAWNEVGAPTEITTLPSTETTPLVETLATKAMGTAEAGTALTGLPSGKARRMLKVAAAVRGGTGTVRAPEACSVIT